MDKADASIMKAMKLLIVSDTAYQRGIVADLARALGVGTVLTAEDAVSAFASLRASPPDVLVADAEMHPHSGLQLTREIRAAPQAKLRKLPVVLYTDENSRAFAEAAALAGVTEILNKPVSRADLASCLTDAAAGGHRSDSLVERMLGRVSAHKSGPALQRATWEAPAPAGTDRAARLAIAAALEEAQSGLEASGDPDFGAALLQVRAALARAYALVIGQDQTLSRIIAAAGRMAEAEAPRRAAIAAAIAAARAAAADSARPAMRDALADSVVALAARPARTG